MTKEQAKNYFIASCYLFAGAAFGFVEVYPVAKEDKKNGLQTATALIAGLTFFIGGIVNFVALFLNQDRVASVVSEDTSLNAEINNNKIALKLPPITVATLFLTGSVALTVGSVDRMIDQKSSQEAVFISASACFIVGSLASLVNTLLDSNSNTAKKIAGRAALLFFAPGSVLFLIGGVEQNAGKAATFLTDVGYVACTGYLMANVAEGMYRFFTALSDNKEAEGEQRSLLDPSPA
ncbi:MAG: hypothetical protein Q8L78_06045 [Coxiellaceae bacterium]|nr:hypothetical protein [Coxiellaceae bacterium]